MKKGPQLLLRGQLLLQPDSQVLYQLGYCSVPHLTVLITGVSLVPVTAICKQPFVEWVSFQIICHPLLRATTLHPLLWVTGSGRRQSRSKRPCYP